MTQWHSDHVQLLDVQLRAVERSVAASASRIRRQVYAKDCAIAGQETGGLVKDRAADLVIYERNHDDNLWHSNPNKIGEIWITDYILISLFASPDAFRCIWACGRTSDETARVMQVTYRSSLATEKLFVFPVTRFAISEISAARPVNSLST